ncbi:hypothetical protein BJF80_14205 [Serinicoccus sp. CUA-874]|uniref:HNH endonuclease signature motif containing protein n=1 Tax=Serinicoccus sp. CUA-874 TaxID=1517939 RepID=UPI0009609770|nr:HNH endonuclease signature motif containing protein [Serinicoccus sp. CUA-874]OLT18746.1 hypothetical protein BJF80_14205 [Serinicoccus sp. CUA-874]
MSRNYTKLTIKLLFGQARQCGYPGCRTPLIYEDRGRKTVVAEIAHIRSEAPGGPRHDPGFVGDLDGPDNLLLLCGVHHKPVDRHDAIYSVEELEAWKKAQAEGADGGVAIADEDVVRFIRLSTEERTAIDRLARLAYRLEAAAKSAAAALGDINDEYRRSDDKGYAALGIIYEVDDDGNKSRVPSSSFRLPQTQINEFQQRFNEAHRQQQDRVRDFAAQLGEEVAVLRLMDPGLGDLAGEALGYVTAIVNDLADAEQLATDLEALQATLQTVYDAARERF